MILSRASFWQARAYAKYLIYDVTIYIGTRTMGPTLALEIQE